MLVQTIREGSWFLGLSTKVWMGGVSPKYVDVYMACLTILGILIFLEILQFLGENIQFSGNS